MAGQVLWLVGMADASERIPDVSTPFALVVLTRLSGVATDEGNARIAEVAREAWGRRP